MKEKFGGKDAESAEATQKTQKTAMKTFQNFFLRPLRCFCVCCVRLSAFTAMERT
ncbi:hypothetical protein ACFPOE_23825 [Caenimonas terrae]|uniref:Uncharacterized protein n=1 Tax=Caenimonas terrae TaxID=696074 RepID=A0ABW0NLY6_9BURK